MLCARLSWPSCQLLSVRKYTTSHQLLSARKYAISYLIVSVCHSVTNGWSRGQICINRLHSCTVLVHEINLNIVHQWSISLHSGEDRQLNRSTISILRAVGVCPSSRSSRYPANLHMLSMRSNVLASTQPNTRWTLLLFLNKTKYELSGRT